METTEVSGDQLEVVVEGRGRNLEIGVREDVSLPLQLSANHPEDPSSRDVVRENGDGREHTFFDVT